jgi:tRNA 2-thiouridine synthesizing protein E
MIRIHVRLKSTGEVLKHTQVDLLHDSGAHATAYTDRYGNARFEMQPGGSGRIQVAGITRYQGPIEAEHLIELWSMLDSSGADLDRGAPQGIGGGSIAYSETATRHLPVGPGFVLTDSEGYILNPGEWSEDFARAQAAAEGLELTPRHWELIRHLREHYASHGVQAAVRDMVRVFRDRWGDEAGGSPALHALFPRGGPQKQGNRLAGLLRTKGEH